MKTYILHNIETNDVVPPVPQDSDADLIHHALFHDAVGVTLANDCLRDQGSPWRWIPCAQGAA